MSTSHCDLPTPGEIVEESAERLREEASMLLARKQSLLLVIDVQERLMAAMPDAEACLARILLLIEGARLLGVPALASEQYPKGLGATVAPVASALGAAPRLEKLHFSCFREEPLRRAIFAADRRQLVLCGVETHVCVLQTALDFQAAGFEVHVVADACDSRTAGRKALALDRLRQAGVRIVDSEMVLFEWLERAGTDEFRAISRLVK